MAVPSQYKEEKYATVFFPPNTNNEKGIVLSTAISLENEINNVMYNSSDESPKYFDKLPVNHEGKRVAASQYERDLVASPNKIITFLGYLKGKSKILSIVRLDKWRNLDWTKIDKNAFELYKKADFGSIDKVIPLDTWTDKDLYDKIFESAVKSKIDFDKAKESACKILKGNVGDGVYALTPKEYCSAIKITKNENIIDIKYPRAEDVVDTKLPNDKGALYASKVFVDTASKVSNEMVKVLKSMGVKSFEDDDFDNKKLHQTLVSDGFVTESIKTWNQYKELIVEGKKVNETEIEFKIDKDILQSGIEYELEFDEDEERAKQRAIENITDIPDYYERLRALEDEASKFDTDQEDWDDDIEEIYDDGDEEVDEDDYEETDDEDLEESIVRKRVVRGGKLLMKKKSNRSGYKISGGKEVRMSPQEMRRRKIAQRKASIRRRAKASASLRKRAMSMRKRKASVR